MLNGTRYGSAARRAALATAAVSAAALLMTACQPGDDGTGSVPSAPSAASSAPTGGAGPSGAPSSHTPSGKPGSGGASSAPAAAPCAAEALETSMRQADVRPDGTGTGAAVVEFTNTSGASCSLQGHPTVAGAANGSPDKGRPLAVTPTGTAARVVLAPGGKAWIKLTFKQVQGEGDGYCASGADPATYPTLVVGLPGAGAHQVALDDGVVAECDDTVTATPVTATKPS
ncbi:DUF4232 domain-containing protein [Streptomyces sp. NBC_01428]|uniref:DUF4232 domain-containing protein n=2 Tax=Streptomyces TaxID=1883 RepID=UPI002E35E166|nr:DUF4232 domain-containing protein [Streptomyces sp. NBC_01428]